MQTKIELSANMVQTSASQGLLGMVGGPTHGPLVDVVQLAARAWAPILITLSVHKELALAITHHGRNDAVVSHGDKSLPPENGGDGDDVGDRIRLRLIQLLCSASGTLTPTLS